LCPRHHQRADAPLAPFLSHFVLPFQPPPAGYRGNTGIMPNIESAVCADFRRKLQSHRKVDSEERKFVR
jgi:hypothetical protein